MNDHVDIGALIEAVANRAASFLQDEIGIVPSAIRYHLENVQKLELRHLTSLMSVEGYSPLYLAMSFDESLIEHAFAVYAKDIEYDASERDMYLEETAGDIVNIIVGNATSSIGAPPGKPVRLSPPVIITEARSIFRLKAAQFFTAGLETDHGTLEILCIGPKDLFDEHLNYLERREA